MFTLSFFLFQKPDGLIFPDRATLYVTAIEDRQYKDYKIHCTCQSLNTCLSVRLTEDSYFMFIFFFFRVGECLWI